MKPDQRNVKLCECGCGEPAPIANRNRLSRGIRKGEPQRFIVGHVSRAFSEETRAKIDAGKLGRKQSEEAKRKLREAQYARSAETKRKMREASEARRGIPLPAEHRRNVSIGQGGTGTPSTTSLHRILARENPKTGVCEECGANGRTEYAFLRHPEPHTTNRDDYRELCHSCHKRLDAWLRTRKTAR